MFISKTVIKTEHNGSLPVIVGQHRSNVRNSTSAITKKPSTELPQIQHERPMSGYNSKELAFRTKLKLLRQRNKSWLYKGSNFNQGPDENTDDEIKNISANTMKIESGNGIAKLSDLLQDNTKSSSVGVGPTRTSSAKSRSGDSQSQTSILSREKSAKARLGDCLVTNGTTTPAPGMTAKQAKDFLVIPGTNCLPERLHNKEDKAKEKLGPNLKLFEKLQHMINKCEVTGGTDGPLAVRPQSSPLQPRRIGQRFVDSGTKKCMETMKFDAKDKKDSDLRTLSHKLLYKRTDLDTRHGPPVLDIVQLKIGGYSYKQSYQAKNSNWTLKSDKASSDENSKNSKSPSKSESVGAIIVPSHTTLDCPLCEVYYDEENTNNGVVDENHFHNPGHPMHEGQTKRLNSSVVYKRSVSYQDKSEQETLEHYQLPLKRFSTRRARPKSAAEITITETQTPFVPHNQFSTNSCPTDSKRFPFFLTSRKSNYKVIPVPNF